MDVGLILLVDMGLLNEIGKKLVDKICGLLLIIDYVFMFFVLEIG